MAAHSGASPRLTGSDIARLSQHPGPSSPEVSDSPREGNPSGLPPTVASVLSSSSPRPFHRSTHDEDGSFRKHFRPYERQEDCLNDGVLLNASISPLRTWMPPDDGDDLYAEQHSSISPDAYPHSANDYTGAVLYPGQLSSLTMYGFPRRSFSSCQRRAALTRMNATEVRGSPVEKYPSSQSEQCQENLATREIANEALGRDTFRNSLDTSSGGFQSNFSASRSESDAASSAFAIRARQAGIPDWNEKVVKGLVGNNSVFDERWVLNPNEAWNVPARSASVLTVSPESQRSHRSAKSAAVGGLEAVAELRPSRKNERSNQETSRTANDREGQFRISKSDACATRLSQVGSPKTEKQSNNESSTQIKELAESCNNSMRLSEVSEAEEPHRLEQYITDLSIANGNLRSKLESYNPASIRKIFYQRVFHSSKPEVPQGEMASRPVRYKGRAIPYGELYLYLLGEIDRLVEFLTAPIDHGRHKSAARLSSRPSTDQKQEWRFIEDETVCGPTLKAEESAKPYDSNGKFRFRPQQVPFHQYKELDNDSEDGNIANDQAKEQVESISSPSAGRQAHHRALASHVGYSQRTNFSSKVAQKDVPDLINENHSNVAFGGLRRKTGLTDPSSASKPEKGWLNPDSIPFRPQTRFGNPATAEFNPTTTVGNPHLSSEHINSLSSPVDSHSKTSLIPSRLAAKSPAYQAQQQAGPDTHMKYQTIAQPIQTEIPNRAPLSNLIHPSVNTAGYAPGCIAGVANKPTRHFATFPDRHDSSIHGRSIFDRPESRDYPRRELPLSSPESDFERSVHGLHIRSTEFGSLPFNYSQYQSQLSLENKMRAQEPMQAVNRLNSNEFAPAPSIPGPMQQTQSASLFGGPALHSEVESSGLVLPYQFAEPARTFILQQRPTHGPHQLDRSWLSMNSYQRQTYQSMPMHQSEQREIYSDSVHRGDPDAILFGQPPAYAPDLDFHHQPPYPGAIAGATSPYVQPYIPADKYARAPAPNRLASRFAHTSALPSVQSQGALIKSAAHGRFPAPVASPRAVLVTRPYRPGSDEMFPHQRPGVASIRYQNLTRNEPPSLGIAGDDSYMPFVDMTTLSKPAGWGVLKVSNMPYDITHELIHSFLGNHAKTITSNIGPCVHIMMDRSTGKTQDCYIEFFSGPDANAWRSVILRRGPHHNKIGERVLEVELSSQEELLKEMFPRARCVIWGGSEGLQIRETEEAFDSGFKGFITQEELKDLIHHAEQPHRSIYTQKCPSRPYSNMVSILSKFPWHATPHYTLFIRNALFNATLMLVKTLVNFLRRSSSLSSQGHRPNQSQDSSSNTSTVGPFSNLPTTTTIKNLFRPDLSAGELAKLDMREKGLNESLLKELVLAGLNAYGFSDSQRYQLYLSAAPVLGRDWMRLSPLMAKWPFEVIGRKAGIEEDVVEFYAHLLSSHPDLRPTPLHQANPTTATPAAAVLSSHSLHPALPFGNFSMDLYERNVEGYAQQSVSMEQLGKWEMEVIKGVVVAMCVG